ncbi:MAG TPA: succinate--CoA ligase subunit beta, partial [Bacteroidales bacterium]|nr:succinate--CoA ligase subunit beta [Bacteroidales bacterium]
MNLHEYQGKSILKDFGVAVPVGFVAKTPEEAIEAAKKIKALTNMDTWAIKAQI